MLSKCKVLNALIGQAKQSEQVKEATSGAIRHTAIWLTRFDMEAIQKARTSKLVSLIHWR
ncbi:hypothetical protein OK016_04180 [Vibrio chagasii]|nr:hypothetical protein [Vibrio chagasii]